MKDLYKRLALTMHAGLPITIGGASVTGRTLIAQTIHNLSNHSGSFVTLNSTILSDPSRLSQALERAQNGAILIEDVHDLSQDNQQTLIELLDGQDGTTQILITLPEGVACAEGLMQALFFRINAVTLQIPKLVERLDDFEDLITHFADFFPDFQHKIYFTEDRITQLKSRQWPGNVRQLNNLVKLVAVSSQSTGAAEKVLDDFCATEFVNDDHDGYGASLGQAAMQHIQRYFDLHGNDLPAPGVYHRILQEVEQPLLEIALDATNGNQAKCAQLLGINRNTLRKKISDLDILVTRKRKMM